MPKILIVEDESDFRVTLAAYIERSVPGSTVTVAADGANALEQLMRDRPDFVVSGIQMPEMNGFALLRTIRRNPDLKGVQVFMMSDSNLVYFSAHAKRLGAQGFIPKGDIIRLPEILTST